MRPVDRSCWYRTALESSGDSTLEKLGAELRVHSLGNSRVRVEREVEILVARTGEDNHIRVIDLKLLMHTTRANVPHNHGKVRSEFTLQVEMPGGYVIPLWILLDESRGQSIGLSREYAPL
jgi:hypothetical protein